MDMRDAKTSSNILAYGYDPEARELHVRFKGYHRKMDQTDVPATTYVYQGVPADVHAGMIEADEDAARSLGTYHRQHVIGGGYAVRKI
jgi:hypothetical protein